MYMRDLFEPGRSGWTWYLRLTEFIRCNFLKTKGDFAYGNNASCIELKKKTELDFYILIRITRYCILTSDDRSINSTVCVTKIQYYWSAKILMTYLGVISLVPQQFKIFSLGITWRLLRASFNVKEFPPSRVEATRMAAAWKETDRESFIDDFNSFWYAAARLFGNSKNGPARGILSCPTRKWGC